jgi:hypothetical protein
MAFMTKKYGVSVSFGRKLAFSLKSKANTLDYEPKFEKN